MWGILCDVLLSQRCRGGGGRGSSPTKMKGFIFVLGCNVGLFWGCRWDLRGGTHSGQLMGCIPVSLRFFYSVLMLVVCSSHARLIALSCSPPTPFDTRRMKSGTFAGAAVYLNTW